MKACSECHIHVQAAGGLCPLCGATLKEGAAPALAVPPNPYPDLRGTAAQSHFIVRLLIFLTLMGAGTSLLVNWLVPVGTWWSVIVIAAMAYLWLSVPPLLRSGVNFTKRIMFQVIFTCFLVVLVDGLTGWRGWSVSYAVPGLLCAGIVGIGAMVVFNRTSWHQYVLYQVQMAVFGFVPLVLWLLGMAQNLIMVIITACLGLASLLVTFVFGDRTLKSEFKRRFHL